jgi:predicted RNA binding protein YcfA (HicA-like mRNA interferase family)
MNAREVIKILKADGWYEKNQEGSHKHFIHPTKKGKLQVQMHGNKDIKKKTLKSIFKQAGLK